MANFIYKTAEQFRDDFLRSVHNGLQTILGIANPNTSYGTDHYILGTAIGKIAELASLNAVTAADAQMPDTSVSDDLYRICKIYELALRPAGPSNGNLILDSSVDGIGIISGQLLIDESGLRYQTSVGGIYDNGDLVPIISLDTGIGTNIAGGSVLRWVSPPAFVAPKALVSPDGMTDGVDAEDDEGLRDRLLSRLRNPIGGGNWSQLADAAEKSTTTVQKAFPYPAYNGPSTVLIAVTGTPSATNKNRDIDPLIVSGIVKPAVQAITFEGVEIRVTTVQNEQVSISLGLALPSATTASPPGPGGGWLDGNPFPYSTSQTPNIFSGVTAVTSTTNFNVYSDSAPTANISHIVYIDSSWNIYHAKVTAFNPVPIVIGGFNTWNITVDKPCLGITPGNWIFPDAVNMDVYIKALLDILAKNGPGQIVAVAGLLPYAYRRPYVSDSWPSDIGPSILKFISSTGDEVLDVQYLYKSLTSPSDPVDVTDGPNILVPLNIGFYPIV